MSTVFSTPSGIFAATGSVGVSIILWLVGGILTFCGLSVFLEFGLAIPLSGGEKNYLERVYRHPRYLATCVLASQMILLGFSSGNSLAFGRAIMTRVLVCHRTVLAMYSISIVQYGRSTAYHQPIILDGDQLSHVEMRTFCPVGKPVCATPTYQRYDHAVRTKPAECTIAVVIYPPNCRFR